MELRLYRTTLIEWMDLGMCIWHPPQILQGRMTSSPTWHRRESLGSRSLNTLPNLWLLLVCRSLIVFDVALYRIDFCCVTSLNWLLKTIHRTSRSSCTLSLKENRELTKVVCPRSFFNLLLRKYSTQTMVNTYMCIALPWDVHPVIHSYRTTYMYVVSSQLAW